MCVGGSRAEAEDIATSVTVDYDELPAVSDMLAARRAAAALVHEDWGDNVFIEFFEDGRVERVAATAAIKVTREIRTSRHCMVPIEGRGVVAYWDPRLGFLTVISASQMPHVVQHGIAECLGLEDGAVRVISPDVGGGFGYKGLLSREEVALAWLARRTGGHVRWIEDCREHLTANANCREHHYRITAYADRDGRLLALDCEANVDAGAYSVYPTSAALEAAQIASLLPGPYDFPTYRCRAAAVATNKCPILPYRGVARTGVCLAIEVIMDAIAREAGLEPYEVTTQESGAPGADAVRECDEEAFRRRRLSGMSAAGGGGDRPAGGPRAPARTGGDGRLIGVGFADFLRARGHGNVGARRLGTPRGAGLRAGNGPAHRRRTISRSGSEPTRTARDTRRRLAQIAHEVLGDRFRTDQGPSGRHALCALFDLHLGLARRS